MILSKDSNNNWTPTASGTGTFIGTLAAFNAIKDTLPVNTVAYITDDGAGIADVVADGNMNPVTSNAVYDELNKVETMNIASLCTDVISCEDLSIWATKSGRVVTLRIQITNAVLNTVSDSYDTRELFTLPAAYRPRSNMLVTWLGQALNDAYCGDIRTDGLALFWQWGSHTAPGTRSIIAQVTYII